MTSISMRNMTVHDCIRVCVAADAENGCLEIKCYDARRSELSAITILVFGPDDKAPLLEVDRESFTELTPVEG
jgi:hypothetical protein